jgi:hypothetical protein
VDDDKCEAELKYSAEEECVSEEKCGGEWFTGPWTQVCVSTIFIFTNM